MDHDIGPRLLRHLLSSLALLTRVPLPDHRPAGAQAAWAWPLVGAGLGAVAALFGSLLLALGLAPGPVAAATLAALALMTGAIHEDGLADTADGLLGGHGTDRRLEIMKDSRIGSFGALALVLVTLAIWSALAVVLAAGLQWPALIAASALSRAAMVIVMAALPAARTNGLSAATGRPVPVVAVLALLLGLLVALICLGPTALWAVAAALLAAAVPALAARRMIGGQTGDILGASQQLAFAAALSFIAG